MTCRRAPRSNAAPARLESLLGIADLSLAREEHQDIAGALGHELVAGPDDAGDLVDCPGASRCGGVGGGVVGAGGGGLGGGCVGLVAEIVI